MTPQTQNHVGNVCQITGQEFKRKLVSHSWNSVLDK